MICEEIDADNNPKINSPAVKSISQSKNNNNNKNKSFLKTKGLFLIILLVIIGICIYILKRKNKNKNTIQSPKIVNNDDIGKTKPAEKIIDPVSLDQNPAKDKEIRNKIKSFSILSNFIAKKENNILNDLNKQTQIQNETGIEIENKMITVACAHTSECMGKNMLQTTVIPQLCNVSNKKCIDAWEYIGCYKNDKQWIDVNILNLNNINLDDATPKEIFEVATLTNVPYLAIIRKESNADDDRRGGGDYSKKYKWFAVTAQDIPQTSEKSTGCATDIRGKDMASNVLVGCSCDDTKKENNKCQFRSWAVYKRI